MVPVNENNKISYHDIFGHDKEECRKIFRKLHDEAAAVNKDWGWNVGLTSTQREPDTARQKNTGSGSKMPVTTSKKKRVIKRKKSKGNKRHWTSSTKRYDAQKSRRKVCRR